MAARSHDPRAIGASPDLRPLRIQPQDPRLRPLPDIRCMVERLRHHPWVNSPSHEAKRLSAWLDTLDPSGTCQYPAVLWAGLRENWSHSVGNDLWQTSVAADQRVPSVPHQPGDADESVF